MKKIQRLLSVFMLSTVLFTACSKDDDKIPEPTITEVSLETDYDNYVYKGEYVVIKGKINAPGKINKISIEIHGDDNTYWKEEFEITDAVRGLENYNLNELIYIPNSAKVGNYHLHIEVEDQAGQDKDFELEFRLNEFV